MAKQDAIRLSGGCITVFNKKKREVNIISKAFASHNRVYIDCYGNIQSSVTDNVIAYVDTYNHSNIHEVFEIITFIKRCINKEAGLLNAGSVCDKLDPEYRSNELVERSDFYFGYNKPYVFDEDHELTLK